MKTQSTTFVRASISFPADIYQILEDLAKQKKVSMAWVVRDAVEDYIAAMKSRVGHEQKNVPRVSAKPARRAT